MQLLLFTVLVSLAVVYGSTPLGFGQCRYSSIRGEQVKDNKYLELFADNWLKSVETVNLSYAKVSYLVTSSISEEKLHEFRFGHKEKVVMIRFYVEFDSNKKLWSRAELCEFRKYEASEEVTKPVKAATAKVVQKQEPAKVENKEQPTAQKVAKIETPVVAKKEAPSAQIVQKDVPTAQKTQEEPKVQTTKTPQAENVKAPVAQKQESPKVEKKEQPNVQKVAEQKTQEKPKVTKTEAPKTENVKPDSKKVAVKLEKVATKTEDVKSERKVVADKPVEAQKAPAVKKPKIVDATKEEKKPVEKKPTESSSQNKKNTEPSKMNVRNCSIIALNTLMFFIWRRVLATFAKVGRKIYHRLF